MVSLSNHRPEPFDPPFALSLSKGKQRDWAAGIKGEYHEIRSY
jgi:hypothetical protein